MRFPHQQENNKSDRPWRAIYEKHHEHDDGGDRFHQQPAKPVWQLRSPAFARVTSIRGGDKKQNWENKNRHDQTNDQDDSKERHEFCALNQFNVSVSVSKKGRGW